MSIVTNKKLNKIEWILFYSKEKMNEGLFRQQCNNYR
jgi:hypothetical protein